MKKYFIKIEKMGGKEYAMIYVRYWWFFTDFLERWNNYELAEERIKELRNN